jgi:hypothetical protein
LELFTSRSTSLTSLNQKNLNLHEGDAQEHRRGPHHQDDQGAQEAFGQQGYLQDLYAEESTVNQGHHENIRKTCFIKET